MRVVGFREYESYDAVGLASLVAKREVSPAELLSAAVERLELLNPALNAVVHRLYDHAEQTIAAGNSRGAFHGIPFLLKDLTHYQGAPTTYGSRLFAGYRADYNSTVTERYLRAGFVVIGKTNTPEFGLTGTTEPVASGPTHNPWDLARSPGGSSGGSAAAVAAGIVPAAHASDGGGSIRNPASCCGLFGLKPTRARIPSGPVLGEGWAGLSTSHVVSRTVRDSAALLDVTHGAEPGDPYPAPPSARPFLEEVGADPGRLRIALMTGFAEGPSVDPECVRAAERAARLCEDLGHFVEIASPQIEPALIRSILRVIMAAHTRNLVMRRTRVLEREFQPNDVERITARFVEEGSRYTASDYAAAIEDVHSFGRRFAPFFAKYDLLLTPTLARPPLLLGTLNMMSDNFDEYNSVHLGFSPFTPVFNMTGQPAASVPLHWTEDGLPIGVQLVTRFGEDAMLLRIASQLESAAPWNARWPTISNASC